MDCNGAAFTHLRSSTANRAFNLTPSPASLLTAINTIQKLSPMAGLLFVGNGKGAAFDAEISSGFTVDHAPGTAVLAFAGDVSGNVAVHHGRIIAQNAALQQDDRKINSSTECAAVGDVTLLAFDGGAARLTLAVEEVRFQQIQDISKADAAAEGCVEDLPDSLPVWYVPGAGLPRHPPTGGECFSLLWDSLHGFKPGERWADNPTIIALTFRVHRANIDAMQLEAAHVG